MNLPSIFNFNQSILTEVYANDLLQLNEETKKYGLELTLEDVKQVMNARNKVLKGYGRVELSFDVTKKLIETFSVSAFVNEKNYVSILNDLQELFYYMKNETEDKLSDEKIIKLMKEKFEDSCEGSIDLLNSCLEEYSRSFRKGQE